MRINRWKKGTRWALVGVWMMCFQAQASQADTARVEQEVIHVFAEFAKAAEALDLEAYLRFFDQNRFVGLNSDGSNWNDFGAFRALVEPGFEATDKVESLAFPNVVVSVIDQQTAVLVNEYEQVIVLKNGQRMTLAGGGTQVWTKRSGHWKLVSVSASIKP